MGNSKKPRLATIAHQLLALENEWQREKTVLLREVRRLRGEVEMLTRQHQQEMEDMVARLQARAPPPVPVRKRESVVAVAVAVEKEKEKEKEDLAAVGGSEGSRRIVFARHPDLVVLSECGVTAEEWREEVRLLEDPARKAMMVKKRGGGQVEVELLLRTEEEADWEVMRIEFKAWMVENGYGHWQRAAMEQGRNRKGWDEKVRQYALQRNGLKYMLEEIRT